MTYPGQITDRTANLESKTLINPAFSILNIIEKLQASGPEVIGIPCNTAHTPRMFDPIEEALNKNGKMRN